MVEDNLHRRIVTASGWEPFNKLGARAMYAAAIEFKFPDNTDWDAIRRMAQDRASTYYRNVPGLRSKAFVVDPERLAYGGLYVWETREQMDAFLASEVFTNAVQKFGQPDIRIYEVAALIEHGRVLEMAAASA
jgi:hypothetical protein